MQHAVDCPVTVKISLSTKCRNGEAARTTLLDLSTKFSEQLLLPISTGKELRFSLPGEVDIEISLRSTPDSKINVTIGASRPETDVERHRQVTSLTYIFETLREYFPAVNDLVRASNGVALAA